MSIAWTLVLLLLVVAVGLALGWLRARRKARKLQDEVEHATLTDQLTGLMNRRAFTSEFAMELERSRRTARALSIVIGDLDSFKEVNDLEGHQAGDRALERLARILTLDGRKVDVAVRMGGEEFALLLPGTDEAGAYMVAERMRKMVSDHFEKDPVPLTISFGVASYPAHGYDVEPLLHAADHALYTAKALGRDRTVICNRAIASAITMEGDLDKTGPRSEEGRAAA